MLFRVRSYADYGRLSGRSVDDMIAGARVEVAPFKEDPMDFVLWKPSSQEEPGWTSPWGRGRPGWHIECSAMSYELLGPSFDIHGGGLDLQFPHHENEVAQSCCAHPEASFARYWMHNEMLQVEGKKMSKSLGNFFTVRHLLDQDVPGEVIRFVYLSTHYRKPMDWTADKAEQARAELLSLFRAAAGHAASQADQRIIDALADDLNTAAALTALRSLKNEVISGASDARVLRASLDLLGFETRISPTIGSVTWGGFSDEHHRVANAIASKWLSLRLVANYGEADAIKNAAKSLGIELRADRVEGMQTAVAEVKKAFDLADAEGLLK